MKYLFAFCLALVMYGVTMVTLITFSESNCAGKDNLGEQTLEYLYEKGELGALCRLWL